MEKNRNNVPRLRQVTDLELATAKKARKSWQIFTIMAEFINSAEAVRIALCGGPANSPYP
jgi:hypothetical protein